MSATWVPPTVTLGKTISAPLRPLARLGHHVAGLDLDLGAETLEGHDQEIDRTRADGAAARHRDARLAHAGEQRRDHPEAGPHRRDELVGRAGVDDAPRRQADGLPRLGRLAGPLAGDHVVDAVIAEDAQKGGDIGEARHVGELERVLGEQARDHQRQGRVLGARDRNGAVQRHAAADLNAIHQMPPCCRTARLRP